VVDDHVDAAAAPDARLAAELDHLLDVVLRLGVDHVPGTMST
jgi:hypothetical protein